MLREKSAATLGGPPPRPDPRAVAVDVVGPYEELVFQKKRVVKPPTEFADAAAWAACDFSAATLLASASGYEIAGAEGATRYLALVRDDPIMPTFDVARCPSNASDLSDAADDEGFGGSSSSSSSVALFSRFAEALANASGASESDAASSVGSSDDETAFGVVVAFLGGAVGASAVSTMSSSTKPS